MKKTVKTLIAALALCLVAGTLQAQNSTVSDQIAAFINAAKPNQPDYSSPTALALRDAVLAQPSVDYREVLFVAAVDKPLSDETQALIAAKTGDGARYAQLIQKVKAFDITGWTDNDIYMFNAPAAWVARGAKNPAFTARMVTLNAGRAFSFPVWQKLFKQYRSTLPLAQQIALTSAEKNSLLNKKNRTAADNQFLTELSAELLALGLDK